MRARRRRSRRRDTLASPVAIRSVLDKFCEQFPALIPRTDKKLLSLLNAVRHVERRPATDTRRGHPSAWEREDLLAIASALRGILFHETGGRVSLHSFIGQYLRVLDFPADVQAALANEQVNLHEAAQLARLTEQRLNCLEAEAKTTRQEVLHAPITIEGSQTRLRASVLELLGEKGDVSSESLAVAVQKLDELLEVDPTDKRHLFYEEMKRMKR